MCHRANTDLATKIIKESSVTVAQQRKSKTARTDSARAAAKDRAEEIVKLKHSDPTKQIELNLKKKMVDDTVKNSEVRRIEKTLAMLERNKEHMSVEVYQQRVNGLLDKLCAEEEPTPADDEGDQQKDEDGNNSEGSDKEADNED